MSRFTVQFTVQTVYRIPVDALDVDDARAAAREQYDDADPAELATWTAGGDKPRDYAVFDASGNEIDD